MTRGDVWWAELPEPAGSAPGFRRPVIVVQSDTFNRSRIDTIMVIPLTSNLDRLRSSGNVRLARKETGLALDSVAIACQIMTVNRDILTERVGTIPSTAIEAIKRSLRLTLDL